MHQQAARRGGADTGADGQIAFRHIGHIQRAAVLGALADQAFADAPLAPGVDIRSVGGGQAQARRLQLRVVHDVEQAMLRTDQGRQLGHHHLRHRRDAALALQLPRKTGQVGLEPVLFRVAGRGVAQVADERIDVVAQQGHLASGVDAQVAAEVAPGHGRGHHRHRPGLAAEAGREDIDAVHQLAPGASAVRQRGLAAEPALDAELVRDAADLGRHACKLAAHPVDPFGQLQQRSAQGVAVDFQRHGLVQPALGDRCHHPGKLAQHAAGRLQPVVDRGAELPRRRIVAGRHAHRQVARAKRGQCGQQRLRAFATVR